MTRPDRSPGQLLVEVAALAGPVVASGLSATIVIFTDRLMLGRYSAETLAAMQIAGPVIWSLLSVTGAFGVGAAAVIGRAVGAGELALARRTLLSVLALALILGVVLAVAGSALAEPIASALAGPDPQTARVRDLAVDYLQVVIPAAPLALVAGAGTVALQAGGDTRTPLYVSLVAGLANLAVSYVLLFGALGAPELGMVGAALGTSASMGLHCVGVLAALVLGRGPIALVRPDGDLIGPLAPVLRVATPALGERIALHLGYLAFVGLVGRLGPDAMAAHAAVMAIESLGFVATAGFGVAASTLIAQRLGASRPDEATRCGWIATGLAVLLLSGVSLLFLALARPLVALFSTDPGVLSLAVICLQIAAVAQPLMAISDTLAGALRGAGDARTPLLTTGAGQVGVRLCCCWWLAFHLELGLVGIWLGSTLDWGIRAVALAAIYHRGRWRRLELLPG